MSETNAVKPQRPRRMISAREVRRRVQTCSALASLRSVNEALAELTRVNHSPVAQIAEVIRQDPSLTTRLLRLVNSVYSGLTVNINNVEEAIFFLGLRQIRNLSIATRVIEEVEELQDAFPAVDWTKLWRHSIGTGIMSREIFAVTTGLIDDDTDYLIGLLHNVGKLVMAHSFPEEFDESLQFGERRPEEVAAREQEAFGWTHAELGALYLERQNLSPEIVEAVRFHHVPEAASRHQVLAAAVQVADCLVRYAGIDSGVEENPPVEAGEWEELSGWKILFGNGRDESKIAHASIMNSIGRLPSLLEGLF